MRRRLRWGWVAVGAVPALFVGYFFAYPVARIVYLGLSELGAGSTGLEARLVRVGWFTLWQAGLSTILTLIVAAPLTWAVSAYEFRGRRLAIALVTVPFVLPTVVVGTAFASLGARGALWAILAAHVFFNVAVVVRTVSTLWRRIDPSLAEAGRVLGASPGVVFRRVTLPLLRPAIASAAAIVFLFTFTSFGVVLILGGFRFATLEVEIYRQAVTLFDLPLAAALAVVQMAGVTTILFLYSRYQTSTSVTWATNREANAPRPQGATAWGVGAVVIGTLGLLAVPLVALAARSLDTAFYTRLFQEDPVVGRPIASAGTSIVIAVGATILAAVVGMMASTLMTRRSGRLVTWFDVLLMLPLGTSAVTIGFGFIVALGWPVDLRASVWLIPIAHALVAVPFVVRTTVPTLRSIPEETREAAAVLGASPWQVWRRIDLPIVARAGAIAAGFAFVISLGEFGATSFVARAGSPTMPIMIFRLLGRPGQVHFGMAMAMSIVLAAITAGVVLWLDRSRYADIGRF